MTEGGSVNFREFRRWWSLKKHGRPTIDRCPEPFLEQLAIGMNTYAYTIGEDMVEVGEYGRHMFILLEGAVDLKQNMPLTAELATEEALASRDSSKDHQITSEDKEPIVGFAATLPHRSF
eukprot:SAG22_NODE_12431_length_443_cov_0.755814_1_plen_119_part_01